VKIIFYILVDFKIHPKDIEKKSLITFTINKFKIYLFKFNFFTRGD